MAYNTYAVGQAVTLSATFKTNVGVATDPTTIALKVRTPDGLTTAYTYAAAQLTRDSAGAYHLDYTTALPGAHVYRFEGAGAVAAVAEGTFMVRAALA